MVGGSSFPPTCRKVSVWEMGGFPAVLPPRVTLLAVAEPLPRNHLVLKGGAPESRNLPPFPKPAWCHPATSPYHVTLPHHPTTSPCWHHHADVICRTGTHPSASCWRQHDVTAKKTRRRKSRFRMPGSNFWGSFWCTISAMRNIPKWISPFLSSLAAALFAWNQSESTDSAVLKTKRSRWGQNHCQRVSGCGEEYQQRFFKRLELDSALKSPQ